MTQQAEEKTTPKSGDSKQNPLGDFVSHQRKAAEEAGQAFSALFPPDFKTHGRAAKKEFLESFKVLIEGVASRVDHELKRAQPSEGSGPSTTGKSKVKVEVS